MNTPEFGVERKVIAFQLSLLGDAPKPCHNWRRPYYTIRFFGGMQFPLMEDEIRQNKLLRADSMAGAYPIEEHTPNTGASNGNA